MIASAPVTIAPLEPTQAAQTIALLSELRVSLFGIHSTGLHKVLVADALNGRVDCRVATTGGDVCGAVLAAPRSYWRSALLAHWGLAIECCVARLSAAMPARGSGGAPAAESSVITFDPGPPPRTWANPGDAWRIIIVGTAAPARGRGIAAQLYRSIMRDRSLVARIAMQNTSSLRLHRSVGWRLYKDGDVVLAVHTNDP